MSTETKSRPADSRPLVICDCDEVLLRMVSHFRAWLGEERGVEFRLEGNSFAEAMRWADGGERVPERDIWRLLGEFFDTEMDRQDPVPGALMALEAIGERADIVVLTNLTDERQEARTAQLRRFGIDARVFTNQGPKGPALARILEEYAPPRAIFIDDLSQHHASVAQTSPEVIRLHLCGEPSIAPHIVCGEEAGDAHARIDTWDEALPWILDKLEEPA